MVWYGLSHRAAVTYISACTAQKIQDFHVDAFMEAWFNHTMHNNISRPTAQFLNNRLFSMHVLDIYTPEPLLKVAS